MVSQYVSFFPNNMAPGTTLTAINPDITGDGSYVVYTLQSDGSSWTRVAGWDGNLLGTYYATYNSGTSQVSFSYDGTNIKVFSYPDLTPVFPADASYRIVWWA